ncbi:Predicted nucleic acid-binding protein, contains PIN domain [Thermanaeromonas toyohensis ToBE]|uniref:Predicted nucleic acid-binding protein, contains PIN domain n=1 Tax=Thermanaeromonas toyohensis ToBE TaxID=698762 RepID=A0A1W1VXY3_9FIRM|nr:type II toxin-antitoxin system VapC family toxin [Thermanaeromonas toyohensis]SMB98215.1 Predicted nucleic acid-binding protein, contains PIN domain [Thermanaeromonas toyohensis ToBE]
MSKYMCLDTSVVIKFLIEEQGSDKATLLIDRIIREDALVVLPAFAWAEVGSVLRKKYRRDELSLEEADGLWMEFRQFPGVEYVNDEEIGERAWKLSCELDLPTLYDAAFLAVAEVVAEKTGEECEYWTADEKLVSAIAGKKKYVKYLEEFH